VPDKQILRDLPIAQEDLFSIYVWIARDSLNRATKFVDKLDERIGILETHPNPGREPRHPKLREYGYRVLIVESNLVFYILRGKTIEIHRVIHGSRNLDDFV
jgi:plasmid stabilization system protein ParE